MSIITRESQESPERVDPARLASYTATLLSCCQWYSISLAEEDKFTSYFAERVTSVTKDGLLNGV